MRRIRDNDTSKKPSLQPNSAPGNFDRRRARARARALARFRFAPAHHRRARAEPNPDTTQVDFVGGENPKVWDLYFLQRHYLAASGPANQ